jgi:hypothetical protein
MRFSAVMIAVLLLCAAPPAMAAEAAGSARTAQQSPLKPGKSAGVQAAQQIHAGLALVGAGAIIAIVALTSTASSGGGNNQPNMQSVQTTTP